MDTDQIRISHCIESTKVLGPGNRFAIWMQGCEKRCDKCINPDGWKLDGGYAVSIEKLLMDIRSQPDIQGVTISGGEPFLQFDGLESLVCRIRESTAYDIMLYSGYTLEEIIQHVGQERAKAFFMQIDIFIDGAYVDALNTGSMYRGSDNQNIYFFTGKYASFQEKIYHTKNRDIEFDISKGNEVVMIGIPPKDFYSTFLEKIGDEGK